MKRALKAALRSRHPVLQALAIETLARLRGAPPAGAERLGAVVRRGPFAGLRLSTAAHGSLRPPELLGRYEAELLDEERAAELYWAYLPAHRRD